MTRRLLPTAWVFAAALFVTTPVAQEPAPDELIKSSTQEALRSIREDKEVQAGNVKRSMELIDAKVAPFFSFARMTQLAVGKNWEKANTEQKAALTKEFRILLSRTYANALGSFKDYTITYKPFRGKPTDTRVLVKTQVNQPGGEPVPIDYSLEKQADGWKVYDVTVGGVSLVISYRDSFASEVRANGIDGLIKSLQAKNQTLAKK